MPHPDSPPLPSTTHSAPGSGAALGIKNTFLNPWPQWLGLCLLLCWPWLNPIATNPSPMMVPWLVSWACVALVWWVAGRMAPAGLIRVAPWLMAWLALWVLAVVLRSPAVNGETVFTLGALLLLGAAIDIGSRAADNPDITRAIVMAWLVSALVSSVIAICQYLDWAEPFYPLMNLATSGEAFGNLRQRNQFATLANMGLAALVLMPWADKSWVRRWAWAMMVVLMVANAASASRTGTLGVGMLMVAAWVWRKQVSSTAFRIAMVAPVVYLLASWGLPYLAEWVTGTRGNSIFWRLDVAGLQSCTSRKALYLNVWTLVTERPWLGWGWRELGIAHFNGDFPSRFCEILDHAHNLPLHLAVELGIPLMLLLLVPLAWQLLRIRPWRLNQPHQQLAMAVLGLLLLHSMLEYPLWYGPFLLAFGLCLGWLWPQPAGDHQVSHPLTGRIVPDVWRGWLTVLSLAMVVYGSVAYLRMAQLFVPSVEPVNQLMRQLDHTLGANWLFARQVSFANLVTTTLDGTDPQKRFAQATRLLHYSPEARVAQAQLEAAQALHLPAPTLALMHKRFQSAFPEEYARWKKDPQASDETE